MPVLVCNSRLHQSFETQRFYTYQCKFISFELFGYTTGIAPNNAKLYALYSIARVMAIRILHIMKGCQAPMWITPCPHCGKRDK